MTETIWVVRCRLPGAGADYDVAFPASQVHRVVPNGHHCVPLQEFLAGWEIDPHRVRWTLSVADGEDVCVPVAQVSAPERIPWRYIYPVPEVLRSWADRYKVVGFVVMDNGLIPLINLAELFEEEAVHGEYARNGSAGNPGSG